MLRTFTIEIDRAHAARLASTFSHIVALTAPGYAKSVADLLAAGRHDDAAFDLLAQAAEMDAARAVTDLLATTDGPIVVTNDAGSLCSDGTWHVPHEMEVCWSTDGRAHIAVGLNIAESFLRTVFACGPSNCDPAAVARDRVSGWISPSSTHP